MTNYIEYKEGKVYDVKHLRKAESAFKLLELAKAGHPLANSVGREIRLLRQSSSNWPQLFYFDAWSRNNYWYADVARPDGFYIAPLAIKDGKPLHIGDDVEILSENDWWLAKIDSEFPRKSRQFSFFDEFPNNWRWPEKENK